MIPHSGTLYLNFKKAFNAGTYYVALGKSISPLSQCLHLKWHWGERLENIYLFCVIIGFALRMNCI